MPVRRGLMKIATVTIAFSVMGCGGGDIAKLKKSVAANETKIAKLEKLHEDEISALGKRIRAVKSKMESQDLQLTQSLDGLGQSTLTFGKNMTGKTDSIIEFCKLNDEHIQALGKIIRKLHPASD